MLHLGRRVLWRGMVPQSLRVLLLFLLCGLLTISCHRSSLDAKAPVGDRNRIVMGTTAAINTLDPADAYGTFPGTLLYNLGDRLYTYKLGTNDLEPQLATAFPTISADGLTYTIPLRQGVLFHDGTRFDARAMAFSLQRFMENGGAPSFLLADLVESVNPTADYELTLKLKKPFAAFPALLAFSGACAVSPQAYEIKPGEFKPRQFVGTGPYKLVKFGTDQILLDAFEQYWGQKPANRGVDIQIFSSPANLFNAFRTRAIDIAYQSLAIEQIASLEESAATAGWQIIERSGSGIDVLTLNLKSPPLDQLEVRQAIAALIDRPLLQERVFQRQIDPLYSLVPVSLDAHQPVFKDQYGDSNIAKAMELLQQAGYSRTHPLKLEFWYRSNVIKDQLAAITFKAIARKKMDGLVQLDLKSVESTTAYKYLDKGAYPIFLLDWTPDFFDPDNYIYPFMECSTGSVEKGCEEGQSVLWGSYYYSNRANQLIDQSRKEQNPAIREQLFVQLQNLLAQDVPFIPLWQNKDFLFAQPGVQGASLEVTQKVPLWTMQKS
ncbi:peptide ABC transporter substrate-binding protein [Leptothermofonsia sichuanensis E412]|uniref:ABC transporter substrate-binding protein n=1 Tax=Leptothermofonsia sichuanensis TaxID=2917832 RepID=UPI001CA7861A|nr:ABC transporter substrate-binding protein [Leptothermofonsia sichuanensis]QZZ20553.1 peptide ABC transporter substrate-binding protein [Leptothermofonsia sichuanensis E412]